MTVSDWRYLDSLESMTEDVNMYVAPYFEYRGKLDTEALVKAYTILSLRHPVIRGFITEGNGKYILETRENEYPEVTIIEGGKEKLRELRDSKITSSANEPADKRPTSSMFVVTNKHGGYIILRLRHSICDPTNTGAFLSQLLDIYTDIVSGNEVASTAGVLPRSPLNILEEQWGESSFYFNCPGRNDHQADIVDGFWLSINFHREDTEALLTAARQHDTTLGSLLLGETVLSLKNCDQERTSNTVKINTLVSLRNRLGGPIEETDTTYLTGRCIIPVDVSNGKDATTLGKEYKKTLQDKLQKKEIYVAGYSMDTLGSTLNSIADIRFNSAGKMGEVRTPEEMDIIDFYGFNFPLGEWRTRLVKNNPTLDVVSWTMNGKLRVLLRGHLDICSIVPELEYRLTNAIDNVSN